MIDGDTLKTASTVAGSVVGLGALAVAARAHRRRPLVVLDQPASDPDMLRVLVRNRHPTDELTISLISMGPGAKAGPWTDVTGMVKPAILATGHSLPGGRSQPFAVDARELKALPDGGPNLVPNARARVSFAHGKVSYSKRWHHEPRS